MNAVYNKIYMSRRHFYTHVTYLNLCSQVGIVLLLLASILKLIAMRIQVILGVFISVTERFGPVIVGWQDSQRLKQKKEVDLSVLENSNQSKFYVNGGDDANPYLAHAFPLAPSIQHRRSSFLRTLVDQRE